MIFYIDLQNWINGKHFRHPQKYLTHIIDDNENIIY